VIGAGRMDAKELPMVVAVQSIRHNNCLYGAAATLNPLTFFADGTIIMNHQDFSQQCNQ
jgi:hypothetical protein